MTRTCRAVRDYREAIDDPENRCGRPVAGFALSIQPADVKQLLSDDDREAYDELRLFPLGYCAMHLRSMEVAQAEARERPYSWLSAGSAHGVIWLDREPAAQPC